MWIDAWVARLGPAYIWWMMVVTRLCGLIGGALVVYYVRLTLELSETLQFHWNIAAAAVVLLAVSATVLLAMWETRRLRAVLRLLHLGRSFPEELGREAGREAVVFPIRHHLREGFVVPLCCLPPVYIYLTWVAHAPINMLVHITIAASMGIATAVSMTYFVIERLMYPVVRHLMNYGVVVDYKNLPTSRLHNRLLFSFTLTIVITALMIATLATQKAGNLVNSPDDLDQVVHSLRMETIAITACAIITALILSTFLARSVSTPVLEMVRAMRHVEAGYLKERISAISTNEIGMLGRSFNRMVERLAENQSTIKELNANLERKVRERTRQLKLAQDRLVHSEKMTSLGELVAGIAHEINNSINAVYNGIIPLREQIEELQEETNKALSSLPPKSLGHDDQPIFTQLDESFEIVNELAEIVERGAKRAAGIVTDLKKFGHPGEGRRSLFDVHEGLKIALNLLSNKLKNRIQVSQNFCDDGRIVCTGTQLVQVFLNVLDNAQQAIEDRGEIFINTQRLGEQIVIRIRDSGSGISEDIKSRIFDPFFTTKQVGVGTGLGLSISYGIIKGHGGEVEIDSPPAGEDHGTEFVITLPVEAEESQDDSDRSPAAADDGVQPVSVVDSTRVDSEAANERARDDGMTA
ncbi:MAG: HAMP domain-containing protein [Planctomycetes bacterium]|nr:HAMP domain-containing protein [Planctomycetota bacterium]